MKTISKTSLIATLAVAGAFTAGFLSGPASAQTEIYRGPFEFQFKYDAAELTSMKGAENVLARLEAVVSAHCNKQQATTSEQRSAARQCVKHTMRASIDKFGNTTLAQAFQSRADG